MLLHTISTKEYASQLDCIGLTFQYYLSETFDHMHMLWPYVVCSIHQILLQIVMKLHLHHFVIQSSNDGLAKYVMIVLLMIYFIFVFDTVNFCTLKLNTLQ